VDIEKRIKDVIMDKLQVSEDEVTSQASLVNDLGADSLEQADILFTLEDEFGITADDSGEAEKLETVGEIVDYIKARVAATT
jgi:acyl carrier protein